MSCPNIQKCNFIANTDVSDFHAIEHPAAGEYNYTGLLFSGNDYDIYYTAAASSGELKINKLGDSDPTTYEILNPTGNTVNIVSSVSLGLTGIPDGTEVTVAKVSDRSVLYHVESTSGGTAQYDYGTGEIGLVVDILFMHINRDPFIGDITDYTLGSDSVALPITLVDDPTYSNP